MAATATPLELEELHEPPTGENDRYAIYIRDGRGADPQLVGITSKAGIGSALVAWHEDRLEAGDLAVPVFGILDREQRRWIASLWHPKEER